MIILQKKRKGAGRHKTHRRMKAEPIIRALIKCEDKTQPLTDRALSSHLAELGIAMRFQMCAYIRNELGILPTHKRRVRNGETVEQETTQTAERKEQSGVKAV